MENNLGNKETMAKNIKRYIEQKGITMARLAADIDVPPTTVSNWVHANSYPRIDKIEAMANYFSITKADLVEEPAAASAIKSAMLIKKYEKLNDRDKQIIENMIDTMLTSYIQ